MGRRLEGDNKNPLTCGFVSKFEAAVYSSIGSNKMEDMLCAPNCPFVLYIGTKKLVMRKECEEYIAQKTVTESQVHCCASGTLVIQ